MNSLYFDVRRIVKIKYLPSFKSDWHTHDFFHYIFVLNGTGRIKISDIEYIVQQDEFYLIPPQTFHEIASYKDFEFTTIEIKFFLDNQKIIEHLINLPHKIKITDKKIHYSLETILKEATNKEVFYHQIINTKFADIILNILRMHEYENTNKRIYTESNEVYENSDATYLGDVIKFIEKNISVSMKTAELARIARLSESYFCTVFKNKFGISPNKYINKVKFAKAKELMLFSDLNITQIAELLGFSSLHYFSKFFKKNESVSPHEYIEKIKNNIKIDISEE
ncbi:MAG: AraC family transcriptional regulator [Ruminiclostridium sp.]|nr:AraC family transcriptional regulator [Ruminiclostridium sp.]